jgi:purine-binding chemotaxis protein CheW
MLLPAPTPVPPAADAHTDARRWLLLTAGDLSIALAADDAAGVLAMPPLARLPGAPAAVAGVISAHGALMPVVDPAALVAGTAARPRPWVVLVARRGSRLALAVDALPALRIVAGPPAAAAPAPSPTMPHALGIDGRSVPLLDAARLMDSVLFS